MMGQPIIFIDGEAGTTGLKLAALIRETGQFELLTLPLDLRKSAEKRREALNDCDIAVLCLPDEAARESVSLISNRNVRVLDASVAHRVSPGWTYGFPEMTVGQQKCICEARRVSNPGCFGIAAVSLIRPLTDAGLIAPQQSLSLFGISGYSGGGRGLIDAFEDSSGLDPISSNYYVYGLSLQHKHLPEITLHSGLKTPPVFVPSVGRFRQGMIVMLPLHRSQTAHPGARAGPALLPLFEATYAAHYRGARHVRLRTAASFRTAVTLRLDPEALNDTNDLEVFVFEDAAEEGRALLVARLDNLGKGSSMAALQNLRIMCDLSEPTRLDSGPSSSQKN